MSSEIGEIKNELLKLVAYVQTGGECYAIVGRFIYSLLFILGKLQAPQESKRESILASRTCSRDKFSISKVSLGGGKFGHVFCGKDNSTGMPVAIKQFKDSSKRSIENEALLLIKFGTHINIIGCKGLCLDVSWSLPLVKCIILLMYNVLSYL